MSEEQRALIRAMATGDRSAERAFFEMWQPRIEHWIASRTVPDRIADYCQEVWFRLAEGSWLRLMQWRGLFDDAECHPHSLDAYIKRITINKVIDLQGAERMQTAEHDPADIVDDTGALGRDPALDAERWRLTAAFEACCRYFTANDMRSIRMWWEGYTAHQIADQINTNPNNVYQRRSYLFTQLRDCLAEKLPGYFRHV